MKTQNSLSLLECGREMHSRRSPPRDRRMIPSSVHSQTIVQQASLSTDQRKGVLIVPEHLYESSTTMRLPERGSYGDYRRFAGWPPNGTAAAAIEHADTYKPRVCLWQTKEEKERAQNADQTCLYRAPSLYRYLMVTESD